MVKAYSTMVWLIVILHAVAAAIYLYFVFSGRTFYDGCTLKNQNGDQICSFQLRAWQKAVYTIVTIVGLLVQCCTSPPLFFSHLICDF